jgi:hypothetical protein
MKNQNHNQPQELTMTPEEARWDRLLNRAIDQEIKYCNRHDKPVTLDKLDARVTKNHTVLLEKAKEFLAVRYRRIKEQHRLRSLKRAQPSDNGDAEHPPEMQRASAPPEPVQPELDFTNIEQFRGLPRLQPVRQKDGHIDYVDYWDDSTIAIRQQMLELKQESHKADALSIQRQSEANSFFDHLATIYGDLSPRNLLGFWREDRQRRAN